MLGLIQREQPYYVKKYLHLAETMREAVETFVREVKRGVYRAPQH